MFDIDNRRLFTTEPNEMFELVKGKVEERLSTVPNDNIEEIDKVFLSILSEKVRDTVQKQAQLTDYKERMLKSLSNVMLDLKLSKEVMDKINKKLKKVPDEEFDEVFACSVYYLSEKVRDTVQKQAQLTDYKGRMLKSLSSEMAVLTDDLKNLGPDDIKIEKWWERVRASFEPIMTLEQDDLAAQLAGGVQARISQQLMK